MIILAPCVGPFFGIFEGYTQGMIKCPSTRACLDPGFESWSQVWIQKSGARSGSRLLDPKIWIQMDPDVWIQILAPDQQSLDPEPLAKRNHRVTGSVDISYTIVIPELPAFKSYPRQISHRL